MDINTKINMCLDINNLLGADAYAEEVAKHVKYCNYTDKYLTCTRMLDVPDAIVIALHNKLIPV